MLQHLHIQNYAIIDDLKIEFSDRLNIITGETGAGKSILMGALGLILGDRADTNVLLNREKKCCIEGVFSKATAPGIADFLQRNDLENEPELLLRREIASNGKSRAFINDTPVSLQQIRELAGLLVDLHRQFDTLALGEAEFQQEVLDALTRQPELLQNYRTVYYQWASYKKELDQLIASEAQAAKERDYQQYLLDELTALALKPMELENIDQELTVLNNAGNIQQTIDRISFLLRDAETPLLPQLKQSTQLLQSYASLLPALASLSERLQSVHIELGDIADELQKIKDENRLWEIQPTLDSNLESKT